jgi:hypothetical protein
VAGWRRICTSITIALTALAQAAQVREQGQRQPECTPTAIETSMPMPNSMPLTCTW